MIRLEHISKSFSTANGPVHAVQDVSLHIVPGEIFGIIGFSGAGKSTLVRCINLLERPDSGKVIVNGTELTSLEQKDLRSVRKSIGMIFQLFNLMPSRTVFENVELPLKLSDKTPQERKEKVLELLRLVGLENRKDSYPSELSGGQKQRVAIARALANDPKVLLCDEATSALDPQTTHSILKLLVELNTKLKLTIVVITHQMSVIKDICDRVAVMEKGKIVEEGTVADIFTDPQKPITRGFIEMASNLGAFKEMLAAGELPGLTEHSVVWFLVFRGKTAGDAVVSRLSLKFGIEANIVYANVDYIKGEIIGTIALVLDRRAENLALARAYLLSQNIKVEEIYK